MLKPHMFKTAIISELTTRKIHVALNRYAGHLKGIPIFPGHSIPRGFMKASELPGPGVLALRLLVLAFTSVHALQLESSSKLLPGFHTSPKILGRDC